MESIMIKSLFYKDGLLYFIDQRKLPEKEEYFACNNYKSVYKAIKEMVVRGAPAIGIAAAYGMVLAAKEFLNEDKDKFIENLKSAGEYLKKSRPTAVNLSWAINEIYALVENNSKDTPKELFQKILNKAEKMHEEDIKINMKMAEFGDEIIPQKATILTHCNTGQERDAGNGNHGKEKPWLRAGGTERGRSRCGVYHYGFVPFTGAEGEL